MLGIMDHNPVNTYLKMQSSLTWLSAPSSACLLLQGSIPCLQLQCRVGISTPISLPTASASSIDCQVMAHDVTAL